MSDAEIVVEGPASGLFWGFSSGRARLSTVSNAEVGGEGATSGLSWGFLSERARLSNSEGC